MKTTATMIGPKVREQLASTVSENAGKHHSFLIIAKDTKPLDVTIIQLVKNNLTIVQCQGEDLAEIRSLLIPQSL